MSALTPQPERMTIDPVAQPQADRDRPMGSPISEPIDVEIVYADRQAVMKSAARMMRIHEATFRKLAE